MAAVHPLKCSDSGDEIEAIASVLALPLRLWVGKLLPVGAGNAENCHAYLRNYILGERGVTENLPAGLFSAV